MKKTLDSSFRKNELDANKNMVSALALAAIITAIIWTLYIFRVFPLKNYTLVHIFMPINIALLLSPILWQRTKLFSKPGFKYFLLFTYVYVICALNIVVPKHGILGWASIIILVNHYYNPKVGKVMFAVCSVMMLFCIYLGMFVGEYDNNLLTSGKIVYDSVTNSYVLYQPETVKERFLFLQELFANGENRYLEVFGYYYMSRFSILTVIFFISNGLNKRTFKLLNTEINISNKNQKIETELNIAREIQLSNLPNNYHSSQNIEIMAELKPAKNVGGDFYDYVFLDEDNIAFIIGDVSDKGTPAAMFMMKTLTCFKNYISLDKSPSEVLKQINRVIFENNNSKMFATCFLGILNLKTGKLNFSNAGHTPPVVYSNSKFSYIKCNTGFVLGGLKETYALDETITLNKGDMLFLYTDGITEARDNKGNFFGENRLLDFFNTASFVSLIDLHYELTDTLKSFCKNADQADDITYMFLRYQGDEMYYKELRLNATQENTTSAIDFVKNSLEENNVSNNLISSFCVVTDEIFSNIAKYAYDGKIGETYIRYQFNKSKKEVSLIFIDKGIEFNQTQVNSSAYEGDAKSLKAGGLGILIVKNFMDSFNYTRINDKNILVLNKKV